MSAPLSRRLREYPVPSLEDALAAVRSFSQEVLDEDIPGGRFNIMMMNVLPAIIRCHEAVQNDEPNSEDARRALAKLKAYSLREGVSEYIAARLRDVREVASDINDAKIFLRMYQRIPKPASRDALPRAQRSRDFRDANSEDLFSPQFPRHDGFNEDDPFLPPRRGIRKGDRHALGYAANDNAIPPSASRSPFDDGFPGRLLNDDAQPRSRISRFREDSPFADRLFNEPERDAPTTEPKVEVSDKDYMLGLKSNLKIDHDKAGDRERFALYFSLIDRIHKVEKIEARKDNPLFSTIVKYAQHDPEMAVELTHKLEGKLAPEDEATAYKVLRACYEQNFREIAKFLFPKA